MNTLALHAWWSQRPPREKALLRGGGVLLGMALVWSVALAPALRTLRSYETQRAAQEAQLQTMLGLQAQAQAAQALPRLTPATAAQALQTSVTQAFGTHAELTLAGGTATVTLRGVDAAALAQWLANARVNARAAPVQARLTHAANGWSGSLQMALPQP